MTEKQTGFRKSDFLITSKALYNTKTTIGKGPQKLSFGGHPAFCVLVMDVNEKKMPLGS